MSQKPTRGTCFSRLASRLDELETTMHTIETERLRSKKMSYYISVPTELISKFLDCAERHNKQHSIESSLYFMSAVLRIICDDVHSFKLKNVLGALLKFSNNAPRNIYPGAIDMMRLRLSSGEGTTRFTFRYCIDKAYFLVIDNTDEPIFGQAIGGSRGIDNTVARYKGEKKHQTKQLLLFLKNMHTTAQALCTTFTEGIALNFCIAALEVTAAYHRVLSITQYNLSLQHHRLYLIPPFGDMRSGPYKVALNNIGLNPISINSHFIQDICKELL